MKNVSKETWYLNDGSTQTPIAPGGTLTFKKGTTINFGLASAEVV